MQPLQIYLDSSDYSTLADPIRLEKEPKKAQALSCIEQLVAEGKIEARFSGFIFGEILQVSPEYKLSGVRRANLLHKLCQGKAVINNFQLYETEVRTFAVSGNSLQRSAMQSANSDCFGINFSVRDAEECRQNAVSEMRKVIQQNALTRKQRRMMEAQYLRGAYLRPSALSMLNSSTMSINSTRVSILAELLVDRDELLQFLCGNRTAENFYFALMAKLASPSIVAEHVLDAEPELQEKLNNAIRANAQQSSTALQGILGKLAEFKARIGDSEYQDLLENMIDNGVDGMRKKFIREWSGDAFDDSLLDAPMGTFAAFDLYIQVAKELILRRSLDNKSVTASDMVDLFHVSYAPYFDLIRLDARTAELYKRVPKILRSKYAVPVPKIEWLQDNYEKALARKPLEVRV